MGRVDKELKWRLEGMVYAAQLAEKKGVDAVKKELRMRGVVRAPLQITSDQVYKWYQALADNLYMNVITAFMYALHNCEG